MSSRSFGWDRQLRPSFTWLVVTLLAVAGLSSPQTFGAVSFSGDVAFTPLSSTTVGNTGFGTFRIDGGSAHTSSSVVIGSHNTGFGFATVTGTGSQWNVTANLFDVGLSGFGRLEVLQGGVVNASQVGQLRIAANNTSTGIVIVDGPGSLLHTNLSLTLGTSPTSGGSALLRIANGATVNSTGGSMQISPLGRLELDGGLLSVNQLLNNGTVIGSGEVFTQSTSSSLGGRWQADFGDRLRITGSTSTFQNHGIIAAEGGEIEIVRAVTNFSSGSEEPEITLRDGTVRVGSPAATVPQLNNSAVLASIGGENDFYGHIMNGENGRIAVTNNSVMIFHDDVEASAGTIVVFPGSKGIFLEDLIMDEDAVLLADIAGTDDDTGFGRIEVIGTADIAGPVDVALAASYAPAAGDTFPLVKAGNVVGAPSVGDAPGLPANLSWLVESDEHNVVLSVVPALAGDYNANGTVDSADYVMWRETRNQAGFGLVADGNHDGAVDDADLGVWRANFGATVAAAGGTLDTTAAVPEPCAAVLLLIAAVFAGGRWRARMLQ